MTSKTNVPPGGAGSRQRHFEPPHLSRRSTVAGATGAGLSAARAEPLPVAPWMKTPGPNFVPYGQPSRFESKVVRAVAPPANPATTGIGSSRTPLHLLEGMMTPSGLHFERSHSGIPDIDPDQHRLVIHGLVKRPLVFTLEALSRYPMTSRIAFVECAGNSGALNAPQPQPRLDVAGDPRAALLFGMDRRETLDAARRSRRRTVGTLGAGRGRRLPPA